MDPPGSGLPPTTERPKEMEDKDDNDSDNIENRNPIDWGDDIAEGDLSAFRDLGPNARVNSIFLSFIYWYIYTSIHLLVYLYIYLFIGLFMY